MNKEQLAHKIVELRERVFALQKEIDKTEAEIAKMKDVDEWPKMGDWYYCINAVGDIISHSWIGEAHDTKRVAIGNVYRTREDAEFAVERLKVLAEMRRFSCECDLNKGALNWCIGYNMENNVVKPFSYSTCIHSGIFFADWKTAKDCVNAIGEERLKKYYFGVK